MNDMVEEFTAPVDIQSATAVAAPARAASGSGFYHISDLANLPPPSFLIDGLYVEKTFNLHYGPPKSGKTHLQSQVFYDLALGTPHFGGPQTTHRPSRGINPLTR